MCCRKVAQIGFADVTVTSFYLIDELALASCLVIRIRNAISCNLPSCNNLNLLLILVATVVLLLLMSFFAYMQLKAPPAGQDTISSGVLQLSLQA
jgi:hypothetical protein